MKKITDRIMLGLVGGFIGNIPKSVFNEILFRKGIETKRYGEIIGGIFMPREEVRSRTGMHFGAGADFVMSSLLGIPLVYLLSFTGKDYYLVKGGLTGLIGMGAFRGIIANIGPGKTYPRDPRTNMTLSLTSTLWGVVSSLAVITLGNKDLFKPKPSVLSCPLHRLTDERE
ncbi:hypothetical protein [Candidatus Formimonas warabiya]|uniref:Uncharacterized protein n=1 Tax=Formimonas warabiya TaxID=1761012 RepID=A0A3G1L1G8_FORW1|nr:hypothetical protein [Candidatus Formimonas warabiya]ATW28469.1 hypothetical protein DCMF_08550 [Candidatus Formimonas warabiya]